MKKLPQLLSTIALAIIFGANAAYASSVIFDNGSPDGLMASLSRPSTGGVLQTESADDFILSSSTSIAGATFTGLVTGATPTIGNVTVEIYRVFPNDSNTVRVPNVPTRVNSPSDVVFDSRSSLAAGLIFSTSTLAVNFNAANSVVTGINPSPNQHTGGEGPVSGQEVKFTVNFTTPFILPADHYFFVPEVQVTDGTFLWLSAGTPIFPDLQGWVRNDNLDPDWLRIGTDIVGGTNPPRFNFAFSLESDTAATPLPAALPLFAIGLGALGLLGWRRKKKTAAIAA
jgi:hypothetical protein